MHGPAGEIHGLVELIPHSCFLIGLYVKGNGDVDTIVEYERDQPTENAAKLGRGFWSNSWTSGFGRAQASLATYPALLAQQCDLGL